MNSSARRASGATQPAPQPPLRVPRALPGSNGRDARKPLDIELNRLRSMFKEIVENYATKVEGEIAQLQEVIAEHGSAGGRVQAVQAMLTSIRQLKLKPEKGRRKDLKRIHDLVQEMRLLTEAW